MICGSLKWYTIAHSQVTCSVPTHKPLSSRTFEISLITERKKNPSAGTLPKIQQLVPANHGPLHRMNEWKSGSGQCNALTSLQWFLGQVQGAMRCKANGWTLHTRMEMENLDDFKVILLPIRENKAMDLENCLPQIWREIELVRVFYTNDGNPAKVWTTIDWWKWDENWDRV